MYKNGVEMEANPNPAGIAALEKAGWFQQHPDVKPENESKPKKAKKAESKDLFKE